MYKKKYIFFYLFYIILFTLLGYYFGANFSKAFSLNKLNEFIQLSNNIFNIFLIFLILLVMISFSNGIKNIFSKKEYFIIFGISFIFMNLFEIIINGITQNLIYITYFSVLTTIYLFYILYANKETPIHHYLICFFSLMIFSFLTIGLIYFVDNSDFNNSGKVLNKIILENNLIILEILNENSQIILEPYLNSTYLEGYTSGYTSSCLDNMIENCNQTTQENLNVQELIPQNLVLFDNNIYSNKLNEKLERKISHKLMKIIYLIFISSILLVFTFFSPIILFMINYFSKKFIKFFSWFFDPFGID